MGIKVEVTLQVQQAVRQEIFVVVQSNAGNVGALMLLNIVPRNRTMSQKLSAIGAGDHIL